MNHTELIKRGWQITWRYRVLWIFGILLALFGGGGGGGGGGSGGQFPSNQVGTLGNLPGMRNVDLAAVAGFLILCCCLLLLFAIVGAIVRLVARAALYRMVDGIEDTGSSPTWREGFRLGWSNRTFRLFLLDLVVWIPAVIALLLLIGLAAAPVIILEATSLKTLGIVLTVMLGLLAIALIIAGGAALSLLMQFWGREVVIGDQTIGQALAGGYALVRSKLKDVVIMWLIMFGIGLAYAIVLLPVVLVLLLGAAAVGGGIGFLIYQFTRSIVLAIIAGLPLFLLILIIPTCFVQGIYLVWESSTWTLAYRQVRGPGAPAPSAS